MSNPVKIRIRGTETVREKWMEVKGKYDLTHGELALEMAKFVLSREREFRRHLSGEERSGRYSE
jgi:hypothetical protein